MRPLAVGTLVLALIVPLARPASAQGAAAYSGWLFPERSLLPDLLAAPREPATRGQLVYSDPDPTAFGPGTSGEVVVSGTIPLVLLAGHDPGDAVVLGVTGAAFARFSFEVVTRELVNTDWVFAVPLVWHRGPHWVQLRYYHTSSHLGDEYQRRFGPSSINFSRDGADLTLYARPAATREIGLGLYAGGLWSLNSHPEESRRWRGRAGLELDPWEGALWRPFAAVDLELEEGTAHGPRTTVQAGLWLPRANDRPLRLAVELISGPSAMGQFTRYRTRRAALGLHWNP